MVQVKIKGQVITAQYGILNTGDILRTDAAFAKHLVEDCAAAEYVSKVEAEKVEEPEVKVEAENHPEVTETAQKKSNRKGK